MIPGTRRFGDSARAASEPEPEAANRGLRAILGGLFPAAALAPAGTPVPPLGRRTVNVAAQVAAVCLGTVLLLLRIPGVPPWDTIFGEDYWEWLVQSLQQPWHLFIAYNGYWQFFPRLIAQLATYLPLAQASRVFAVSGALVAACCGLFVFHASAGHIQSVKLRALLGVAVVLLPGAPMELADSAVDVVWYLVIALFWAVLWRPRTRTGMAVAAVLAFVTVASNSLAVLFAPLLLARVYVLRRPREHAVTIGWVAGCLAQVPFIVSSYLSGDSRLAHSPEPPRHSIAFYAHDVVLPSLGWHLSWWLQSFAGRNGATLIVAVVLAVVFGVILITQAGARVFVVTALIVGFIFAVGGVTLTGHLATSPMLPAEQPGSRYTALPVFLIEAAVIVAADHGLRRRNTHAHDRLRPGVKPAIAVTALVAVLAATWAVDFRYAGWRSGWSWDWAPIAAKWEHDCAQSRTGEITERAGAVLQTIPCANIRS